MLIVYLRLSCRAVTTARSHAYIEQYHRGIGASGVVVLIAMLMRSRARLLNANSARVCMCGEERLIQRRRGRQQ